MIGKLFESYFSRLYRRTMNLAYERAYHEISDALRSGGVCLDCGCSGGEVFDHLSRELGLTLEKYQGIEWNEALVRKAGAKGLRVMKVDLNTALPFGDDSFDCVFGLSVLEHLINGCQWIRECRRVLRPGGKLVILTPNISTLFSIYLLAIGKMPSSGPHPDSQALRNFSRALTVKETAISEISETPTDRHLVVFSYRALKRYLQILQFRTMRGVAFGLYPFPCFMQPALERLDPYHCHQMVFSVVK